MPSRRQELFEDEQATTSLLRLFELTGIPKPANRAEAFNSTQKQWLRKPGQERWHICDKDQYPHAEAFAAAFTELGMFDTKAPQHTQYDYAILLGDTLHCVRSRLAYLLLLHNNGIRFDKLIALGGQRPLDPAIEETNEHMLRASNGLALKKNWQAPLTMPTNESEMMRLVLDQTELPFSSNDIIFIDTPMLYNTDGNTRRPTTGDTFASWLKTNPTPGRCLIISSQPYIGYQNAVASTYLPDSFEIETVGEGTHFETKEIPVLLDTVARWLYQTHQLLKT